MCQALYAVAIIILANVSIYFSFVAIGYNYSTDTLNKTVAPSYFIESNMENSSEVKQFIFNFSSKEDEFSLNISYNVLKNHKTCKKFFKSKNILSLLEKTNFESTNHKDFQLQINRNAISNVQISPNRKPQISRKLQTNTLTYYSFQAKVRIAKENIVKLMCQALYAVAIIILANVLIFCEDIVILVYKYYLLGAHKE